jgi:hypothetical protein
MKDQLRRFRHLLSEDEALKDDVLEAKAQLARWIAAGQSRRAEPDFDKAIRLPPPISRSRFGAAPICWAGCG